MHRGVKMVLGPFLGFVTKGSLIFFNVPGRLSDMIVEHAFRDGLLISPRIIKQAYKIDVGYTKLSYRLSYRELEYWGSHLYWIRAEAERGYDLFKHFRLMKIHPKAVRIPRLIELRCKEHNTPLPTEGAFCAECNSNVAKPVKVEVWRDPAAREETLGPFKDVKRDNKYVNFIGKKNFRIPKYAAKEIILTIVPSKYSFSVKILTL